MRQVRTPDDQPHATEPRFGQPVMLEQHLEGAARAVVAELRPAYVERGSTDTLDVLRPRVEGECRLGGDEAAYRPGGRDAIDVQPLASDVSHELTGPHGTRFVDRTSRAAASSRPEMVTGHDRAIAVLERDHPAAGQRTLRLRTQALVLVLASGPNAYADLRLVAFAELGHR